MRNPLLQLAAIGLISATAALATWRVVGPPERGVPCDPATLEADEICLETLLERGTDSLVWVDARSREEWQRDGFPASLLWNLDPAEDAQVMEAEVITQLLEGPTVIVYCGDEDCGVSRDVANRIRQFELAREVLVLHGGWRALSAAGLVNEP